MEALNIDDKCHVHWRGGEQLLEAVVVERRPIDGERRRRKKKKQKTTATKSAPVPAAAKAPEKVVAIVAPLAGAPATKAPAEGEAPKSTTTATTADADANAGASAATATGGGESKVGAAVAAAAAAPTSTANASANNDTDDNMNNNAGLVQVPAEDMEYYVHYVGHDRRLDEWLTIDCFEMSTLKRAEPKKENNDGGEQAAGGTAAAGTQQEADSETAAAAGDEDGAETVAAVAALNSEPSDRTTLRRGSASGNHSVANGGAGGISVVAAAAQNNGDDDGNTGNDAATTAPAAAGFSLSGGNWHGGRSGAGGGTASGDPIMAAYEREHEETTKVKNIEKIVMGTWEVEAWYYSPFPDPYSGLETLYVCEYCLSYMRKVRTFRAHKKTCCHRHPPGREIYRESDLAVYELDGKDHRAYCQKLCLLAKLFLDHKTLYYDVQPFLFYVVCKVDEHGAHIAGYFSKEKVSAEGYNLACILTFPQFQKAGYGKFIISLSYELTKLEGKTGSPEKPLSDLGKLSYRSYWTYVLMNLLANQDAANGQQTTDISINSMSKDTGIKTDDLISTLQWMDMIKVYKQQHVVFVEQARLREYMDQKKNFRLCKPEYLTWTPPTKGSDAAAAADSKN